MKISHHQYLVKFLILHPWYLITLITNHHLPSARIWSSCASKSPPALMLCSIHWPPPCSLPVSLHMSLFGVEPDLSPLLQNPIAVVPSWIDFLTIFNKCQSNFLDNTQVEFHTWLRALVFLICYLATFSPSIGFLSYLESERPEIYVRWELQEAEKTLRGKRWWV